VAALTEQAGKALACVEPLPIPEQQALAAMLVEKTFADTVFFTNSGTEAANWRSRWRASTGTTRASPSGWRSCLRGRVPRPLHRGHRGGGVEKMTKGFGPLMPGFVHLPWGDHEALRAASPTAPRRDVEPVQGEGGIRPLPDACLKGLRACATRPARC
jgi:acetylornithine/N-succinyldiaminopimelate aminotransferase